MKGLAINSVLARAQTQLHIHIDCLRADVHEELIRHAADIGSSCTPFPVLLAGDPYSAPPDYPIEIRLMTRFSGESVHRV